MINERCGSVYNVISKFVACNMQAQLKLMKTELLQRDAELLEAQLQLKDAELKLKDGEFQTVLCRSMHPSFCQDSIVIQRMLYDIVYLAEQA